VKVHAGERRVGDGLARRYAPGVVGRHRPQQLAVERDVHRLQALKACPADVERRLWMANYRGERDLWIGRCRFVAVGRPTRATHEKSATSASNSLGLELPPLARTDSTLGTRSERGQREPCPSASLE